MAQAPAEYREFKGLLPGVDRKRIVEPYVVDGANFIVDIDGPVSTYGKTWLIHQDIDEPRGFQTLNDQTSVGTLYFVGDAICRYDSDSRQLYPIYSHVQRQLFWPWTSALVGNKLYLANFELFGAGYLEYDQANGTFKVITDATNMPLNVYGVAESFGRLIVMSADRVNWSVIEDGTNLLPSTSTGAGFQKLSIVCSTDLGVTLLAYAKGFLVYTCSGILRGEFTNSANPFRFDVLSKEHLVLNAWSVIRVSEEEQAQHVMMTTRGLYATFGESMPTLWGGLMSEHFHRNILPNLKIDRDAMTIRLSADFDTAIISVSVSEDSRLAVFTKAFSYYVPSQQWGVYSQPHTALTEIFLTKGAFEGRHFAVSDLNGSLFRFSFTDSDILYPASTDFLLDYKTNFDLPIQFAGLNAISIARTIFVFNTNAIEDVNEAGVFDSKTKIELFLSPVNPIVILPTDEDPDAVLGRPFFPARCGIALTGAALCGNLVGGTLAAFLLMRTAMALQVGVSKVIFAPAASVDAPLNAFITIGPIRFPEEDAIDFIMHVQEGVIGMLNEGTTDTFIDWIADFLGGDQFVDWGEDAPDGDTFADWGRAVSDLTQYKFEWIGTLDGYTPWQSDVELPQTRQEVEPETISKQGRIRQVAGGVSGTYILAKISAFDVGDIFHLKHLKVSSTKGGRVF